MTEIADELLRELIDALAETSEDLEAYVRHEAGLDGFIPREESELSASALRRYRRNMVAVDRAANALSAVAAALAEARD